MNTSRDIEKLFDHFGGNAGDYQEIGRENEAKTARTRWPLLATLDLAQPAIPEIAQRRETQSPVQAPRVAEPAPASTAEATPINRSKPPLFARPHRRTIPVVDTSAKRDSLSASRFGPLTAETEPEIVASVPEVTPAPVPAVAATKTVEPQPSILGQLFKPQQAEPAPVAQDNALNAMFDRLRKAGDTQPRQADTATTRPRRTWGPRS